MKPSEQMSALMSGKPFDTADDAVRSWLRLEIYRKAKKILDLPKDRRKDALNKVKENIRESVKAEVIRIHGYAKSTMGDSRGKRKKVCPFMR